MCHFAAFGKNMQFKNKSKEEKKKTQQHKQSLMELIQEAF